MTTRSPTAQLQRASAGDDDLRFNGERLRARRLELGLSERRLAALLGIGFSVTILRSLEAGTNDDELNLAGLRRLAATLDLRPHELLTIAHEAQSNRNDQEHGPLADDEHLSATAAIAGALLVEIGRPIPDQVLAELLDINLEELQRVLSALDSTAAAVGLHLRRVHRATALVPHADVLNAEVAQEACRRHLGRSGLDRGQVFVLAKVQREELGKNLSNDTRTRAASLVNAGVLERNASGGFELSGATRFSLCLDSE